MAVFNKFGDFSEQVLKKQYNFTPSTGDVFKLALTNTAPVSTQTNWNTTDHPPPAAANGYTAGGNTITISSVTESPTGTTTVSANQTVFTATAGGIGPFRYAVFYNNSSTAPTTAAIGWWDYGSSITLNSTETFTVQFSGTNPGAVLTAVIA
jgi:hypothetical protein